MVGCDLDEVAAGVVEDGCGDRAHVGWRLCEAHTASDEPLELGRDVVDGEGRERDAVLDERLFDGRAAGCSSGSSESSVPSVSSGETTVSQECSPSGMRTLVTFVRISHRPGVEIDYWKSSGAESGRK